jgi:hypothetical protein
VCFQPGNRWMESGPDGFGRVVCHVAGRMVIESAGARNWKQVSKDRLTSLALPLPLPLPFQVPGLTGIRYRKTTEDSNCGSSNQQV